MLVWLCLAILMPTVHAAACSVTDGSKANDANCTCGGNVLAVDYSVEAFGSEHYPFVILCIVCMVVFVIGIPFAVLMALHSNHKYLFSAGNTKEHRQKHEDAVDEFGTLYLQCKSCFKN